METAGQYTYIYAFAFGDAAIASPYIAAYSIVTVILSRIFLKRKIKEKTMDFNRINSSGINYTFNITKSLLTLGMCEEAFSGRLLRIKLRDRTN